MRTWDDMADDLAQALRARGLEGVIGVGHSMGGVATLLASVKHPKLFRAVVALDPVLFTGSRLLLFHAARRCSGCGAAFLPPAWPGAAATLGLSRGGRRELPQEGPVPAVRSRVLPGLHHPRAHRGARRRLPPHHPQGLGGPHLRDLPARGLAAAALGPGANARGARRRHRHAHPGGPGARPTHPPRRPHRGAPGHHPPLPAGAARGVCPAHPGVPRLGVAPASGAASIAGQAGSRAGLSAP